MKKIWFKVNFNKVYADLRHIDAESVGDGEEFGESEVLLVLPDCYSETGAPVPLIFSSHGSGGHVCEATDEVGGISYVTRCIDSGYAAFDLHGTRADGRSYGNRRYLEAVHRAYVYILENYNVQEGLFVAGASMGGLNALNFANLFARDIRVLGIFYPRTNLRAQTANGKYCIGVWEKNYVEKHKFLPADIIAEEYGFASKGVYEPEKTVGLDPWYNNTLVIDGLRYTRFPCPLKIWHGNKDLTIDYELSVEYVNAVRRAGCYAELRTVDGQGHKHNAVMREELRIWFDRFR